MDEADAREKAQAAAAGARLPERLAERIGAAARASAIFGDVVEWEGVMVIPVARARWGVGGGSGGREGEEGSGGGGGAAIAPIGWIELRAGEARFRPINHRTQIAAAAAACALAAAIAAGIARKR